MAMYQAVQTFGLPGRAIREGDLVADDDPILVGRESLFRLVPASASGVEQATAAPGERRARRKAV